MVPNHDQPVSQGSDGGGLVQLTSQDVRGLSDHRTTVDLVLELAISDLTWNQQTDNIYIYVYIGLSRLLELRKPEYDWGVGWGGMLTFM